MSIQTHDELYNEKGIDQHKGYREALVILKRTGKSMHYINRTFLNRGCCCNGRKCDVCHGRKRKNKNSRTGKQPRYQFE